MEMNLVFLERLVLPTSAEEQGDVMKKIGTLIAMVDLLKHLMRVLFAPRFRDYVFHVRRPEECVVILRSIGCQTGRLKGEEVIFFYFCWFVGLFVVAFLSVAFLSSELAPKFVGR